MLRSSIVVSALVFSAALSASAFAQESGSYGLQTRAEVLDVCEAECRASGNLDCGSACEDGHKTCILQCTSTGHPERPCMEICLYGQVINDGEDLDHYRLTPGATQATSDERAIRQLGIGVNLRGYVHNVPNFILGSFLEEYQSHWDGSPKYIFGGELVFRRNEKTDIIVGLDWADYRTKDGWWLQNDEPIASSDWVENSMRTVTLSVEWNAIANLDQKNRAQIYGGVGLGAAFRLGNFTKWDVPEGCFARGTDIGLISSYSPTDMCPNLSGVDLVQDGSVDGEANSRHYEKIPRVLPSLILTAGFRYLIADVVSIGIEGGFKTAGFYGGLELGFITGKR